MSTASIASGSLLGEPHHDGSPAYCPDPPKEHGDAFTVLLRTSAEDPVSRVAVRQVHDGEPTHVAARIDRRTPAGTWWRADLVAHNTVSHYRFLLDGGSSRVPLAQRRGTHRGRCPRRQ